MMATGLLGILAHNLTNKMRYLQKAGDYDTKHLKVQCWDAYQNGLDMQVFGKRSA